MTKWADYLISGIWKSGGSISHYAVHNDNDTTVGKATKMSKADAIALLSKTGVTAKTIMWNYKTAQWTKGEKVEVVKANPAYLRTDPDDKLTDNLGHMINYDPT